MHHRVRLGSGVLELRVARRSATRPPRSRANGDGGSFCASLASDPNHCGGCTNVCSLADAGGLVPGSTNNPDAGVPLNGYDAGTGWNLGTAICDAATCGVTCPAGMTACSDGICYDTNNYHDHCGTCTTACAPTEWCNHANCCPQGQEYCGTACTDVLTDNSNCGTCGNVCSGTTPYCSAGTCVMGCVPTGTRQAFNTLSSSTVTGCWTGNPCGTDTYSWRPHQRRELRGHVAGDHVQRNDVACIGHRCRHQHLREHHGVSGPVRRLLQLHEGRLDRHGRQGLSGLGDDERLRHHVHRPCRARPSSSCSRPVRGRTFCCLTSGTGPDTMVSGVSAW